MSFKNNKIAVFMIDGFDMEYYHKTELPVIKKMAKEGFFKAGSGIFPSLTNANNISIACGAWPETHGVTTNCYYDKDSDKACFLEDPSFLQSPTIFELAGKSGGETALLTCKSKTAMIIGHQATYAIAAEAPDESVCKKYGTPPPMYSSDINYWLFDVAIDMVKTNSELELIYVHTTDYPMHMWAPEDLNSQEHMMTIDERIGAFHEAAPEYTIILTADHGMNKKTRCWDIAKACSSRGVDIQFAVSPVADRLLKHHGGFGGVSYVYLKDESDRQIVKETIDKLEGIDEVLDREVAARRFSLMESRIGDIVVLPDVNTVFGDLTEEMIELPNEYRSHGSLYEMNIPLMVFNGDVDSLRYQDLNYNLDLTKNLIVNRNI